MSEEFKQICYTQRFGAVPKWPKGEVCKTSIRGFESHPRLQISSHNDPRKLPAPPSHALFPCSRICSIICRIAAVEPGARFSRQESSRLHVSSLFENSCGFLKAARQAGTIDRMRSHTTQISPLLSKKSSSLIRPRFTMLATISQ